MRFRCSCLSQNRNDTENPPAAVESRYSNEWNRPLQRPLIMENQSSDTNAQMTALNPVLTLVISAALVAKGEKQPFAASAKSKEQREESGPSGHLPVFSVVQTRRMAAESPNYRMLQGAMNDRKPHGSGHSLCSPRQHFHDHFNKKLNL